MRSPLLIMTYEELNTEIGCLMDDCITANKSGDRAKVDELCKRMDLVITERNRREEIRRKVLK
jgi:hypothetical protein